LLAKARDTTRGKVLDTLIVVRVNKAKEKETDMVMGIVREIGRTTLEMMMEVKAMMVANPETTVGLVTLGALTLLVAMILDIVWTAILRERRLKDMEEIVSR
jgi:hypothetical protein